jgi:YrbI family 3-deoxy-D-manno-octulosonate 8-phosphate phosphatase
MGQNKTLDQAAGAIGTSPAELVAWERGMTEPSLRELVALADYWNCPVDALLRYDGTVAEEAASETLPYAHLRLLVLDVDGVLTDGRMILSSGGQELKAFNSKDGLGIKRLLENDIAVALLSSGKNLPLVMQRAGMLNIERVAVGERPKLEQLELWRQELQLNWNAIGYVGDDINDAKAMAPCGLRACPADAVPALKRLANIQLEQKGGQGCVRELIDRFIIAVQPA